MHSYNELARLFEERFRKNTPFPDDPESLYEPCKYLLGNGGKYIRPVLCLMANELIDDINEDAWHAAFGVELFHNFTLIHDDIMDKAPLRRGKPTIHTRNGMTAGILCGDVMCIYSYRYLSAIRTSLPEVLEVFNTTGIEICEGQQLDMDFENSNNVAMDEYIRMIALKTSVLLACSLKIGAIVGGALGDTANNLYEFGRNMGISFQLQDDYLDAFGDPERSGKQVGGDIKSNKKTFLLIKALELANPEQKAGIHALLQTDSPDKVDTMLQLFRQTGAEAACKVMIRDYSDAAFRFLDKVAIPAKRKQPLMDLAEALIARDK